MGELSHFKMIGKAYSSSRVGGSKDTYMSIFKKIYLITKGMGATKKLKQRIKAVIIP